jgi:hypothetical protein
MWEFTKLIKIFIFFCFLFVCFEFDFFSLDLSRVYGFKWSIIYIQNYYYSSTFSKKYMKKHNNMCLFMDYLIYFIITISPLIFFSFISPICSNQLFKKFTRVQPKYHEPHPILWVTIIGCLFWNILGIIWTIFYFILFYFLRNLEFFHHTIMLWSTSKFY